MFLMDKQDEEIYISKDAKPLYDFIACKETCSIYVTPSGHYFSVKQRYKESGFKSVERQSIKLIKPSDLSKMEIFLPQNVPSGHVAISIFPELEYIPF